MPRSDFSRKAQANFQNYFFYTMCFSSKSTSISRKIEVHIESNFLFNVSIDVFNLSMQLT